jgi:RES domain/HEPN/RES N-terminal domain 1
VRARWALGGLLLTLVGTYSFLRLLKDSAEQWVTMFREWDLTISDGERGVCPACVGNPTLRAVVGRHADIDRCAFCGREGPAGMRLQALFEYMYDCIGAEWRRPLMLTPEGDPDDLHDSGELLRDLDEPLANETLRQEFVRSFKHGWSHHDADPAKLSSSWWLFAQHVKYRARYLFLRTGHQRVIQDHLSPAQVLDELAKVIVKRQVIRRLPVGSRIFRARAHEPDLMPSSSAELGPPPPWHAPANRMSPAGICLFYGAEDAETALAELRPLNPDYVTIASWVTTEEISYVDLNRLPAVPDIFDMGMHDERPWISFLNRFATEIARPVDRTAGPIDYVPTQVLTEYVRDVLVDREGAPVRGIRYRSAVRPGGTCWVLFPDATPIWPVLGHLGSFGDWALNCSYWFTLELEPASIQRFRLDTRVGTVSPPAFPA